MENIRIKFEQKNSPYFIVDVLFGIFTRHSEQRPELWHCNYCFVESGEAFKVKENKHTHARTHARTHTHTHRFKVNVANYTNILYKYNR